MGVKRCGAACFGSNSCKNKRECSCRCGDLQGINESIHEACVLSCQGNSSWENVTTGTGWMYRVYDPHFLWSNHKILVPGYDLDETPEKKAFDEAQGRNDSANSFQVVVIAVLGFLLLGLVGNLIFRLNR